MRTSVQLLSMGRSILLLASFFFLISFQKLQDTSSSGAELVRE